jgi:PAS domain-containing protein
MAAGKSFWRVVAGLTVLLAVVAVLAWMATRRTAERELAQATAREALVADGRAAAVASWLADQQALVKTLADNPSVQIYAEGVALGDDAVVQGQQSYLRTLLQANADRAGLLDVKSGVAANIPRALSPGLAVINGKGETIASIGGPLPKPAGLITGGDGPRLDVISNLGGTPALRLLSPVVTPGGGAGATNIYLVRRIDDAVSRLLVQPGEPATSGETALLAPAAEGGLVYLTARRGVPAGTVTPADPLARAAVAEPGRTSEVKDGDGTRYLVTARKIEGSSWTVMRLAPATAIVDPITSRQRLWLWSLVSGLALAASLVLLAWRQGVAERATVAAETESGLRQFINTVADRQPSAITVLDDAGRIRFANATARAWAKSDSLEGAGLEKVLGTPARAIEAQLAENQLHQNGSQHLLVDVALLDPASDKPQKLVVAQDISDLVQERARREANLSALVQTLAGLIDARDPGSHQHSSKVSRLAQALGAELAVSQQDVETLRISGLLLNIGKILVPTTILTKAAPLTDSERATVSDARRRTAELLSQVPFDGPVAATIAGATDSAPATKLSRILKLANAFTSMTSPRAHRTALGTDAAIAQLRDGADAETTALVSALAHWLDNKGGREML